MAEFMDVHHGMVGITADGLMEAHNADLAIQSDEGVVFKEAWADPATAGVLTRVSATSSPRAWGHR